MIDVWHAGAPAIDFISPDIYDKGFKDWVAKYHLHNNPLFIPETHHVQNNGVRAFYVLGEHDAIGISPFAIEDGSAEQGTPFVEGYEKLREMMPLITKWQGQDCMWGLLFDQHDKERVIEDGDLVMTCRHNFTLPWDPRATDGSQWPEGGGIIIRLDDNEYVVAGNGIVVEFRTAEPDTWCGIGSVDEVEVNPDGTFSYIRRLNGDQDHQGRHVRISVGDYKVLHIKLYEYR